MTHEHNHYGPLPMMQFVIKVAWRGASALLLLVLSLIGGMLGYMHFEHLSLVDAFLNSAMLLGGMGPVDTPHSAAGKIFAGFFALYAGLVFVAVVAIILTPFLSRILRRLHGREMSTGSIHSLHVSDRSDLRP